MSGAYYNEIDEYAAKWLRNLIRAGHIADGVVDTRSIEDVRPSDLRGFTQCHFFAGIGGWSVALRRAGWADDRPIWTGSCPCQPFSAAGKGLAFADERHLWPAYGHLVQECTPSVVVGEQVAAKDVDDWIDLVHADLEAMGYAVGSVPFPSAGVGAPHLRDRNYWGAVARAVGLADSNDPRLEGRKLSAKRTTQLAAGSGGMVGGMAYSNQEQRGWRADRQLFADRAPAEWDESNGISQSDSKIDRMADSKSERRSGQSIREIGRRSEVGTSDIGTSRIERPGPTNGPWRVADWLGCTDDKWRAVEPGTFPLVDGVSGRMGRLRAYGNAINVEAGRVFIEALMECI